MGAAAPVSSCLFILAAYVAPFYLPHAASTLAGRRLGPPRHRDVPATIAFRAACAVGGCLVATAALYCSVSVRLSALTPLASIRLAAAGGPGRVLGVLLRHLAPALAAAATAAAGGGRATAAAARQAARELAAAGLQPTPAAATAVLLGLTRHAAPAAAVGGAAAACLLAWPLAQKVAAVRAGRPRRSALARASLPTLTRDYVIAPVTEEWAFRGCLLPLLIVVHGVSTPAAALLSALTFSAAHLHHAAAAAAGAASPALRRRIAAAAAAQCCYTLPFGLLAAALTLRTGSPASAAAAHAVANVAGLPALGKGAPGGRRAAVVGAAGVVIFLAGAAAGVGRGPGAAEWAATATALSAA